MKSESIYTNELRTLDIDFAEAVETIMDTYIEVLKRQKALSETLWHVLKNCFDVPLEDESTPFGDAFPFFWEILDGGEMISFVEGWFGRYTQNKREQ